MVDDYLPENAGRGISGIFLLVIIRLNYGCYGKAFGFGWLVKLRYEDTFDLFLCAKSTCYKRSILSPSKASMSSSWTGESFLSKSSVSWSVVWILVIQNENCSADCSVVFSNRDINSRRKYEFTEM